MSLPGSSGSPYDRVEYELPGVGKRAMTRKDFEALPLTERLGILLGGKAKFFLGDQVVDSRAALAG